MNLYTAYIGLGGNTADSQDNFNKALMVLNACPSILSVRTSSFYRTSPLGPVDQPDFLNGVAEVRTSLPYRKLFERLGQIEQGLGRQRGEHWGPRVIDLDLLLFDEAVVNEPDLKIPHPQMHLRSFVLTGLCELAPDLVHPVLGQTMQELAGRLNGGDYWLDTNRPQLISIAGNIGVGKTTLATGLAERLNAAFIPEQYDGNPYLPQVYAGKTELALKSELFFLESGAAQLRTSQLSAPGRYVSDYVFDKALIYASGWLNDADLAAYRTHYEAAKNDVAAPVLVIYLEDSLENCLDRIHQRNRPYEQKIEIPFLEHLARGYDALYTDYTVCPVMRIRPDQCRTADQVDRIANEVRHYIA